MKKIIFIVGPTGVGKSAAAVRLAKKIGGEIVSCDSMQVYKGMDIISAQPNRAQRKAVTHHLLSIIPPDKEYDVSRYRKDATKKIKQILKRGKVPIFSGGTGLYVNSLADGIFEQKAKSNSRIRSRLYKIAELKGSQYLYRRLKRVDLAAAEKIHPNDTRRIVRALEVFEVTGKPISELQKLRRGLREEFQVRIFCLDIPREKLYKRIDARVERMFKEGAVTEVKKLLKNKLSKTAKFAIGINEIKRFLNGEYDLTEAKRLIKLNSRRYAKRQLTWFRKDKSIKWINADSLNKGRVLDVGKSFTGNGKI